MRWPLLPLVLLAVPSLASAADYTLEEIGAMAPAQQSFTNSPLLELTGLPSGVSSIDPVGPGERGGGYDILDVGNVSLVAGPWDYNTLSGDHIYGTLNEFLGTHEDEYDFVSIFVTQSLNFGAFYSPLQNDTDGIGSQIFDQTSQQGYGELEGFLFMNSIFDYLGSVRDALFFGQEVGHRWSAYVRRSGGGRDMLGRDDAHWNFFLESQNSTMEGNAWIETAEGEFETDHLAEIGYSELDQYLMGFRAPEDVSDWFLIENPQIMRNPYGWPTESDSPPYYAIRTQLSDAEAEDAPPIEVRGDRRDISLDEVIAVHGERDPTYDESQRDFRMAFVIMMPSSEPVTFDDYLVIEDISEELVALWETMVGGEASLSNELGTSGLYDFAPTVFEQAPAYEPAFDSSTETGLSGSGCQSDVGAGRSSGGALALLGLALAMRRRRVSASL